MTEHLNELIAALREELQQYGEMLALLEQQQGFVVARAAEDLFQSVAAVQTQANLIQNARRNRERFQAAVARLLGLDDQAPFADLQTRLPDPHRSLVQALVQENNDLLARVQHIARQNHLLLSRSLELMRRFMNTLFPPREAAAYTRRGRRPAAAGPSVAATPPLYDAVG